MRNMMFQTSDQYAPYTGVAITSILESNRDVQDMRFFIFGEAISQDNQEKFRELEKRYGCQVELIDAAPIVAHLLSQNAGMYRDSFASYFKDFAPNILKERYPEMSRLVFFEADMLMPGDLTELFTMDLKGKAMAMALCPTHKGNMRAMGLDPDKGFYNAGMMVIDLDAWKSHDCERRLMDCWQENKDFFFGTDEGCMNLALHDDVLLLPLKYDYFTPLDTIGVDALLKIYDCEETGYYSRREILATQGRAAVYHCFRSFCLRPWEKGNTHPQREMWMDYLNRSPWKGMELRVSPQPLSLKMQRWAYRLLPRPLYIKLHRAMLDRFFKENHAKVRGMRREA